MRLGRINEAVVSDSETRRNTALSFYEERSVGSCEGKHPYINRKQFMARHAVPSFACLAVTLIGALSAGAQPRLVILGSGQPMAISANGTGVGGNMSQGSVLTIGSSVVGAATPGFSIAASSADQLFLAGTFGGEPSRWNTLLGTTQGLGTYSSPSPGVPSGTMANIRSISANGR